MDVGFGKDCRSLYFSVKDIGIKVCPVWPGYGSQFRIDANLSEVAGIPHRLEDSPEAQIMREIYYAFNTVLKLQIQSIIA